MADGSNGKPKTELLDQLEKGPWPSFVKEIKSACATSEASRDLLGQLELSYKEKKGHWKHGGLVAMPDCRVEPAEGSRRMGVPKHAITRLHRF